MSGIATDIKSVYAEVGIKFDIVRDSGIISGEYLDWEPNQQVTKPFIREFFLECALAYDTDASEGEVIQFMPSGEVNGGERYLLMNKTPDIFENEIIKYDGVLYKCNVSGELFRPSGEAEWDTTQTYRKVTSFEQVREVAFALQSESLFGSDMDTNEELGLLGIEKHELYIPLSFGIQELDRYSPVSGEYYRVDSIKKRRFKGVDVCILSEDTR
uniref:Uncharacterized protein n=1 Tax=viral metagenome TaxID=1070528 RepID=A0A6M3J720_9ZZZZ